MTVLDPRRIEARIEDFRRGREGSIAFSVTCRDATPSTNAEVKDALRAGCPEGVACVAVEQTAGYGRQGRSWTSPAGGAYVSVCLRPGVLPAKLPTLSLVVSLAVRSALVRLGSAHEPRIKWPNDVVCAAGKLCGISLEALAGGVCVGIGVNALRPARKEAVGGKNEPAYAFEGSVGEDGPSASQARTLEDVAACVLAELDARYARWRTEGFEPFCREYNQLLSLRGASVEAVTIADDVLVAGVVDRADECGCLLIRQADGSVLAAQSGEIHLTKLG